MKHNKNSLASPGKVTIGGKHIPVEKLESPFDFFDLSMPGIEAKAIDDFAKISMFDKSEIAGMMDFSEKTLSRYTKENRRLSPKQSEYLLKLFLVFVKGREVFGNVEEFRKWLELPAYGLDFKVPAQLLLTPAGIDLILDELMRIAYGDLA